MTVQKEEKEWLRRINGARTSRKKEQEVTKTPSAITGAGTGTIPTAKKTEHRFKDVADMDELKKLVTEGFINVLNHRECAKAFGIVPPSILLYGPAGCGKTFFVESLADLTMGYNCSDISYIVKVASRKMFNESIAEKDQPYKVITQIQLEEAIARKSPSVSSKELCEYERIRSQFSPNDKEVKKQRMGFC